MVFLPYVAFPTRALLHNVIRWDLNQKPYNAETSENKTHKDKSLNPNSNPNCPPNPIPKPIPNNVFFFDISALYHFLPYIAFVWKHFQITYKNSDLVRRVRGSILGFFERGCQLPDEIS